MTVFSPTPPLTYAAAKENDVNMENITNELLWNRRQHEDRKDDVDTAASILPSERFKDVKFHDKRVRETYRSNIRRRVRAQGNNSANQDTPQNGNSNNSSENQVVAAQVGRQNGGR